MIDVFTPDVICPTTFRVGSTFKSLDLCRKALVEAFSVRMLNESFGTRQVRKSHAITGTAKAVLACKPDCSMKIKVADMTCKFRVDVAVEPMSGDWRVNSITHHSCGGAGDRKRTYNSSIKTAGSAAVEGFIPTPANSKHFSHGDAKRLRDESDRAGDIALNSQQSYRLLRALQGNSLEQHVLQVGMLPSYFARLREKDPSGTYLLETEGSPDGVIPHLKRFFICMSWMKKMWRHSRKIANADGTHSTAPLDCGIYAFVTVADADNKPFIVALAVFSSENEDNWKWLIGNALDALEGPPAAHAASDGASSSSSSTSLSSAASIPDAARIMFFVTDKDKGGTAAFNSFNSVHSSWCIYHASKSLAEAAKGSGICYSATLKQLALAPDAGKYREVERRVLQHVHVSAGPTYAEALKGWLDANKGSFATAHIGWPVSRFGQYTSNGAEQSNGALRTARGMPIVSAIEEILDYTARKVGEEVAATLRRKQSGNVISMWAMSETTRLAAEAHEKGWRVQTMIPHGAVMGKLKLHAKVGMQVNNQTALTKKHNVNIFAERELPGKSSCHCDCGYTMETGRPCLHAAIVLKQFQQMRQNMGLSAEQQLRFTMKNPALFDPIFSLEAKARMLDIAPEIPATHELGEGQLLPPLNPPKKKGRKKKRYIRDERRAEKMKNIAEQYEQYLLGIIDDVPPHHPGFDEDMEEGIE